MAANVLDFILVTDDSTRFHEENLKKNKGDYSFLGYFGAHTVRSVQGTGVYFNTLVKHRDRTIKYGVINSVDFKADLLGKYTHSLTAVKFLFMGNSDQLSSCVVLKSSYEYEYPE